MKEIFSEVILDIMIKHKLSQEKIAMILQVNQTTVGQWLSGKKKPSYDSINAIYENFGITPNKLFGVD